MFERACPCYQRFLRSQFIHFANVYASLTGIVPFELQFLHVQPLLKAAKKISAEIWGYALWVCGVRDWEKNAVGAKKQNFVERKGPINVLKHCYFLLITVKICLESKCPERWRHPILLIT